MTELRVRQIRSSIGSTPKHRGTLRALGLGRIGQSSTLPDRPEIRGMIARVPHLIQVEEGSSSAADATGSQAKAQPKKAATKKTAAEATSAKAAPKKASAKKAATKTKASSTKAVAKKAAPKKAAAKKAASKTE